MNRGLLYQGLVESGLWHSTRELSPTQSKSARNSLEAAFCRTDARSTTLWDSFRRPILTWQDVTQSLTEAFRAFSAHHTGTVLIFEEQWRDPTAFETKSNLVEAIIRDAWYPSDDVYICDPNMNWCLVCNNYDSIALY